MTIYARQSGPADVLADKLDLAKLGFDGVEPEAKGRPAYHPATLLKIYVYGYLNRAVESSPGTGVPARRGSV